MHQFLLEKCKTNNSKHIFFLSFVYTGLALKCKICDDDTCSHMKDETCAASPSDREAACLVHIYKDGTSKKEMIEKKCVNRFKDTGKYDCIKKQSTEEEIKCYTCTEDFCNEKNAASKLGFGVLGIVSVIFVLLVPNI